MSYKAARIRPGPTEPILHARKITEQVVDAWYSHHVSGALEIPVSVVAGLCLVMVPWDDRNELAAQVMACSPDQFAREISMLWKHHVMQRPDLANRLWPLMEWWVGEERRMDRQKLSAAKAVADAALRYDLFSLTRFGGLLEVDLLGMLLTDLRPKSSHQARGQYYTPGPVAEVMAVMAGIGDGERIADPCCGTGGMFRGAAAAIRGAGRDPADMYWEGNDLDTLAVACCAVNVTLWGLGYKVLLGVGDTIKGDWRERAIKERAETIGLARDVEMIRAIQRLTAGLTDEDAVPDDSGPDDSGPDAGAGGDEEFSDESPEGATADSGGVEKDAEKDAGPVEEPVEETPETTDAGEREMVIDVPPVDLSPPDVEALTSEFWEMVDLVAGDDR